MLPGLTLPASWRVLLETFRPAFRRSSTFALFELLATGLVARAARRTVVGMLAGGHGGGGVVPRVLSVLLGACLGCRSARPGAGAADRDQAARRGRADRGGRRRHPVPPLGPAGVRARTTTTSIAASASSNRDTISRAERQPDSVGVPGMVGEKPAHRVERHRRGHPSPGEHADYGATRGLCDQPGGQQGEQRERARPAKRGPERIQQSTPRLG